MSNMALSWTAAVAGSFPVDHYNIYRGGVNVAQATGTTFTDTGLLPSTTYSYFITAVDTHSNESAHSATVSNTTNPASADAYASVDGSPNAPTGTPQYPNALNGYIATGQTPRRIRGTAGPPNYAPVAPGFQPPWMVAGVDYPVGPHAGTVFKTPTSANVPPGCTVDSVALGLQVGTPFNPSDTADRVFDSFDFTNWGVTCNSGNSATFTNCKFIANAQLFGQSSMPGGGNGGTLKNLIVKYCTFDSTGCSLPNGPPGAGNNNFKNNGPANVVVQYCWLNQGWTEAIQIDGDVTNTVDVRFNLFSNCGRGASFIGHAAHGDMIQIDGGNTTTSCNFSFNTALQNPSEMPDGPTGPYGTQVWSFNAGLGTNYPNGITMNNCVGILPGAVTGVNCFWLFNIQELGADSPVQNNYVDMSAFAQASPPQLKLWLQPNGSVAGPFPGTQIIVSGNISMVDATDGTLTVAAGGSIDNIID